MRRTRLLGSLFFLSMLVCRPSSVAAHDAASDFAGGATTVRKWFPPGDFYPREIADPVRPQNALTLLWLAETEVPATGAGRFGLRLGGILGIYRWQPHGDSGRGWQVSFEGGFAGQFDMVHSLDNTAWDGFFGLYLDRMLSPDLVLRVGTQHDSSHIGDEYSRRTGRERIEYTREEIVVGASWRFRPGWRTYGELGFSRDPDGEGPWSVQTGLEFVSERRYWKGRASRYAAIDVRSYQETDWSARLTVQAGYWIPVGNRSSVHRLAVELGSGRSVMGQFLREKETWLGIGWYYDF